MYSEQMNTQRCAGAGGSTGVSGPSATTDFAVPLCGIGDNCGTCCYSWLCPLCALANARSDMDGSPCIFNFCCASIVPTRWLIRTAYGIPGDACSDCCTAICCPCCTINQLAQTTKRYGAPNVKSGVDHNGSPWDTQVGEGTCQGCFYALFCYSCAVGSSLEQGVGMPFMMGCCFVNMCFARNIIRYHYRLKGNDITDECLIPSCLYGVGFALSSCIWCLPLCILPHYLVFSMQMLAETGKKKSGENGRYISGYTLPENAGGSAQLVHQQTHSAAAAVNHSPPGNDGNQYYGGYGGFNGVQAQSVAAGVVYGTVVQGQPVSGNVYGEPVMGTVVEGPSPPGYSQASAPPPPPPYQKYEEEDAPRSSYTSSYNK